MKAITKSIHAHRSQVVTAIDAATPGSWTGEHVYYPRYQNTSNLVALGKQLASLENAERGLSFSSGMAAITTSLLAFLKPGDHALFVDEIYGGTYNFIKKELTDFGIEIDWVSGKNLQAVEQAVTKKTKVLYLESPSNPLVSILDLEKLANLAKSHNLISMIDSTFASPVNQKPVDHGIDVVLHSGTKYLGGHSDMMFGAVMTSDKLMTSILAKAVTFGGLLNPLDVYLVERSLKTLYVRVLRQNFVAHELAKRLENEAWVARVYYPGLPSHNDHELAKKYLLGYGGMLAFRLSAVNSIEEVKSKVESLRLIKGMVSLGGLETLISSPFLTSHKSLSIDEKEHLGINPALLRISCGLEDPDDLIDDLRSVFLID